MVKPHQDVNMILCSIGASMPAILLLSVDELTAPRKELATVSRYSNELLFYRYWQVISHSLIGFWTVTSRVVRLGV